MHHSSNRFLRVLPAVGAFVVAAGCVIVSSSTNVPPPGDSGPPTDSGPRPDAPGSDGGGRPRAEVTRELLASLAERVILPTYRELATATEALASATAAYAESGSSEDRAAAQEAWRTAMEVVQRAELMQVGPAGMQTSEVLGGMGYRDAIYAWPAVNRCRIDVITQQGQYGELTALAAQPLFVRSLAALDYLLFFEPPQHACSPGASVTVDDAAWNALGADAIRQRRADYAHAVAQLVDQSADALLAAWEPAQGNFAGQLAGAGESGSIYPTTQAALNAVFVAMFYLDKVTKDLKLGAPAARNDRCMASSCPEQLESQWAGRSIEHVLPNLVAFQQLYLGGPAGSEATGFDDLLRAVNAADLAADLETAVADAIRVAEATPSVDRANLADQLAAVRALYDAVKAITDLLKADFRTTLDLELPMGAGEDND